MTRHLHTETVEAGASVAATGTDKTAKESVAAAETTAPREQAGTIKASIRRRLNWLAPGIGVKRYLFLIPVGIAFVLVGVAVMLFLQTLNYIDWLSNVLLNTLNWHLEDPRVNLPLGLALVLLGLYAMTFALFAVNRSIVSAIAPPESLNDLPEVILRRRALSSGAKIVVIGGGTGLAQLLRGLKQHTSNLTAIVAMSDDGGSSGLLQKQLPGGMLPPGDIRNCLVALADAEPVMQELFKYRFKTVNDEDGLSGHNFGNLLIAAMADITKDFEEAVEETSRVLAIRGRVLPSTVDSVVLVGEMEDGSEVIGESQIAKDPRAIRRIKLSPTTPKPVKEALNAIRDADIIVMGPGSVFTSVIPNLLVKEISQEISKAKAPLKVYVCNVMTQRGETDGYTASDHVRMIEQHAGRRVFDEVMVNKVRPTEDMLNQYRKQGAQFVEPDVEAILDMNYTPVLGNYMSESEHVRHDSKQLAHDILERYRKVTSFLKETPFRAKG